MRGHRWIPEMRWKRGCHQARRCWKPEPERSQKRSSLQTPFPYLQVPRKTVAQTRNFHGQPHSKKHFQARRYFEPRPSWTMAPKAHWTSHRHKKSRKWKAQSPQFHTKKQSVVFSCLKSKKKRTQGPQFLREKNSTRKADIDYATSRNVTPYTATNGRTILNRFQMYSRQFRMGPPFKI